jgi:hypothetical protein
MHSKIPFSSLIRTINVNSLKESYTDVYIINQMSEIMFECNLFKRDFRDERPHEFKTLFIPTKENYYKFVQILDKLLSENINKFLVRHY